MNEADQIRKEMAQIRLEMHHDVAGVIKDAESVFDWRSYIRNAPWVSVGAAIGLGYLIVPKKWSRPQPSFEPRYLASAMSSPRDQGEERASSKRDISLWSIAGAALSMAAPIAIRAAQGYAVGWIEDRLLNGGGAKATPASGRKTSASSTKFDYGNAGAPVGGAPDQPSP